MCRLFAIRSKKEPIENLKKELKKVWILRVRVMVFNATFNNISPISWWFGF
jgi:hypothetical protein